LPAEVDSWPEDDAQLGEAVSPLTRDPIEKGLLALFTNAVLAIDVVRRPPDVGLIAF
jgi:hypothetical protein